MSQKSDSQKSSSERLVKDMRLDKTPQRIERGADGADRVGHGRQRDRRAFERIALGLAVQRLMLAELLEHDHRQAGSAPPSRARRHGTAPALA